jgi:hypothetical protein
VEAAARRCRSNLAKHDEALFLVACSEEMTGG